MAGTLAERFGQYVIGAEMIARVYGAEQNGGPGDANGAIRKHIFHLRRKLKATPITIEGKQGGRARTSGYRLAWRQEAAA